MPKDEVIAALEKAAGPCRELDARIQNTVFGWHKWASDTPWMASDEGLPTYTASIDAALTLVPEGAIRHIEWCEGFVEVAIFTERYSLAHGAAPTPAIALCLAALRATERGEAGR